MGTIHYLPRGVKLPTDQPTERRVSMAQTLQSILEMQQRTAARVESLHAKVEALQPMHMAWQDASGAYRITKWLGKLFGVLIAIGSGVAMVWYLIRYGEWKL